MQPELPDRLAALPFFHGADPALLSGFDRQASWRSCGPGDVLLDFEDRSTEVQFVVSGLARVIIRTPSGREMILADLAAGELFGEIAAIDGRPRSANVTAITRSRICALPAATFLAIIHAVPPVCDRLLRLLAAKLRLQTERALERDALSVRLRLCAELLRLSREQRGKVSSEAPRIVSPPPPQHELAARIGARREAVSREMTELSREGLLARTGGGILLPQPRVLRALIDAGIRDGPDP
ncbi:Crp/Fnr family transcriptional regulator [Siccirubricoccus sp. G192]|uniref:Crp/Fnr family transcriptional regulator n=1 Tax=Siccirubricoccus sp. G192 TaxID=2849651 RepID=UPI001C2B8F9B|nr:Crp/Fnr family transcriptional regulator [Siccirubricoccus sp. G192]MBV1797266.1 Crp/Fnr family transcriptional regulator [Siccirubricoccus sp. G192]